MTVYFPALRTRSWLESGYQCRAATCMLQTYGPLDKFSTWTYLICLLRKLSKNVSFECIKMDMQLQFSRGLIAPVALACFTFLPDRSLKAMMFIVSRNKIVHISTVTSL